MITIRIFVDRPVLIDLRRRNLNPTVAKDMMVATLRWRDEFNIEAALKEEYPKEIFGQLGHVYGRDKGGRPVV